MFPKRIQKDPTALWSETQTLYLQYKTDKQKVLTGTGSRECLAILLNESITLVNTKFIV